MNVALSAVVIFLILAPGFTFFARFRRVERTSLEYSPLGIVVISGVVYAAILHAISLGIAHFFGWRFVLEDLLHLIGIDPIAQSATIKKLGTYQSAILTYFSVVLFVPIFLAPALRNCAERRGWDAPASWLYSIFGLDAPWYQILVVEARTRRADVHVAAVVNFGGKCFVVRGFVRDFFLLDSGELDRLVLEAADRRPLDSDKTAAGSDEQSRYYQIDGDFFVLRYSEAITLNVKYIYFDPNSESQLVTRVSEDQRAVSE